MLQAAGRVEAETPCERERILICKNAPPEVMDQTWAWGGRSVRVDEVGTLADAIALCLREPVDRLIVNMFSFTSLELTALSFFRDMRPSQHVVVVCREDVVAMLLESNLADECHAVRMPQREAKRTRRVRP